jgi:hypothetical protein
MAAPLNVVRKAVGDVDNRSRDADMADAIAIEMQTITRRAAEPWLPGDSVKAAIGRASRALGIGYRRARSFWYGEAVAVRAIEADRMRAAEQALLAKRRQRLEHELAAIEARLDAANEAAAGGVVGVARETAGEDAEPADVAQREADGGGAAAGSGRVGPWDALHDADRRRP